MYENLKTLRESLNMTQKDFAASVGVKLTTYSGYETGVREPKSDFWIAVAQKYGVTIDYLMGYSDNPHKTGDAKVSYTEEASARGTVSEFAVEDILVQLGYISPNDDLSDLDFEFLLGIGKILEAWFGNESPRGRG